MFPSLREVHLSSFWNSPLLSKSDSTVKNFNLFSSINSMWFSESHINWWKGLSWLLASIGLLFVWIIFDMMRLTPFAWKWITTDPYAHILATKLSNLSKILLLLFSMTIPNGNILFHIMVKMHQKKELQGGSSLPVAASAGVGALWRM